MIIHGGEPPFIENPDPAFGEVIIKLNEMAYQLQECVASFNEGTRHKLDIFNQNMSEFTRDVVNPINAHLAARGAVHGETKKTIGLSKKDNYRTATFEEQRTLTPVWAYVTPQGARAAVLANAANFNPSAYQLNDAFQFASYYYPNEYTITPPTVIQGTRYFSETPFVPLLLNTDRIVASPQSDASHYQRQVGFISGPSSVKRRTQLSEIQNLTTRYLGANWNALGAETAEGKVALFKPLADKKIFEMKSALNMSGANRNFLLFSGYGSSTYKGLATAILTEGSQVTIQHRFFKTDLLESDPTLVDLLPGNYAALITQINKGRYTGAASGSHFYDVRDFVNLSPGQTIEIGGNGLGVVTSLTWNAQDLEIYLLVAIPIIVKSGAQSKLLYISFVESIMPGTLSAGGSANITQLGTLTKDTIGTDLLPVAGSKWVKVNDVLDMNNPVQMPGVVLPGGEIVKASTTKYGVRVKRLESGKASLKDWMTGARGLASVKNARTEIFVPSRYTPFGAIPDRMIPVEHTDGTTRYLIYTLNKVSGQYEWRDFVWASSSIVGVETAQRFGVNLATIEETVSSLGVVPQSLSIYASGTVNGVAVRGLAFTKENNFTGYQNFGYANKKVTYDTPVTLSIKSKVTLTAAGAVLLDRAAAANPTVNRALREINLQVFVLNPLRALAVVSDGLSYAEGTVLDYTITDGQFILTIPPSGLGLQPLTTGGQTVKGNYRESLSNDGVANGSSDLLAIAVTDTSWNVALTRPFGKVYGDISFTIPNVNATRPVLIPNKVNPARLWYGIYQLDLVDELHPPVLIPKKGLYQYDPANDRYSTNLAEVGGVKTVDPHDINEAGWVRIPAGSRVVVRGRAYILDQEYPIKVNPTGVTYCYLVRNGDVLVGVGSDTRRETANNEVMFGVATNGILSINNSYLVLDNHVLTPNRRGAAVPVFEDNGGQGVNTFFTRRDLIN